VAGGLAAQFSLADPATPGGDKGFEGEADHADGVDMGELGDHERPRADVQADQAQRFPGRRGPDVAEQPVAGDQAAVLPAVQDVTQGGLCEHALDAGAAR
jgi:hypothetical protein